MTWFKVDDTFHAHPKVLATEPAALGLWVIAASWSSANLTEGFVPDHVLPRLLPDSATLARALVTAGLWSKVRGGHKFHDWTDYNPSKQAVENERRASAERQRRWREAKRNGRSNAVTDGVTNAAPTRPVPPRPEGSGAETPRAPARRDAAGSGGGGQKNQSAQCQRHIGQLAHNCSACRSERIGATE